MELLVLDKNFQICGLIDDYSSFVWNRKYYDCGNFSLQVGLNFKEQFANGEYLYNKNFKETARIEAFSTEHDINGCKLKYSGRFLESLLEDRCIDTTQYFKNMITEDIIRQLITTYFIDPGERKVPKITLGERKGLGRTKTTQKTGGSVLDYIYNLCKEDELSISLKYDFDKDILVFEVWQGLDRTDGQEKNTWAIFSRNFENILKDDYSEDSTQYKNFAYVAGERNKTDSQGNQSTTRTMITVDRVKQGEDRRELYVDAKDLQTDEDTTEEEYKQMLIDRGNSKLDECAKVESSNFSININSNLEYKSDFDLGDKVIYKNDELGFNIENRIIEVSEAYENGEMTLDVVFGKDYDIKRIKEAIK